MGAVVEDESCLGLARDSELLRNALLFFFTP